MPFHPEQFSPPLSIEGERESRSTGAEIWNAISADIRQAIEQRYRQPEYDSRFYEESERLEEIEIQINREHEFVARVWDTLNEFASHNRDRILNLLFDIDETLGEFVADGTDHNEKTLLRPSAVYLINRIQAEYGDTVRMGFLTTRGKKRLDEQLDMPEHLLPIAHAIDRSILFSTRELIEETDWDNPGDVALYEAIHDSAETAATVEYCRDILDPRRVAETEPDAYWNLFRHSGDKSKTSLLARLVREHPDQAYMAVDDFPYPSILKKDSPHIRGIWLDQNAAFYP